MFLLRRTAVRAISSPSSIAISAKPRSITTITPAVFRLRQQQYLLSSFQRRFASDDAVKRENAAPTPESFAQTAAEAPVDEDITPAQPTDTAAQTLPATSDLKIRISKPKKNKFTEAAPKTKTLYVGNLFYEVTADQLTRIFSRFGNVKGAKIIADARGLSRGFGYVEFESEDEAQIALENLDMQVFEGRNLVVQFHRVSAERRERDRPTRPDSRPNEPTKTLFIGNMAFEMSDKDLNDLFRDVRNVVDVRVAIDRRTGQPRGFAHADFIDVASAADAREKLAQKTLYGRQLRVDFTPANAFRPKEKALGPN